MSLTPRSDGAMRDGLPPHSTDATAALILPSSHLAGNSDLRHTREGMAEANLSDLLAAATHGV
jgi:hypothetical protein